MPTRPVVVLPDPALKKPASPIHEIDDAALALVTDLTDTMRAYPRCVGLAATQIGVSLRAIVVDVTGHPKARSSHGLVALFNPEVVSSGSPSLTREGCLSVPHLTGDVVRAEIVAVRGVTPDGEIRAIEADAFEARAFLHEIDHLDGLLFLDKVSSREAVFRRKVYR
jgi:peptide deformylase